MEQTNLEQLVFTKPKKVGNFLVSKIKYCSKESSLEEPFLLQFPKMTIVNVEKNIELEFKNDRGYTKEVYDFLSKIDTFVIDQISIKSEEWFGKKIPTGSVAQMYNKFIKAPITTKNNCTLNFCLSKKKELVNQKNESIDLPELSKNATLQVIGQLKYVIFSKDSSFVQWEILTGKMQKKVERVSKNGFIEDPDDHVIIKDDYDSDIEINSFF